MKMIGVLFRISDYSIF